MAVFQVRALHRIVGDVEEKGVLANFQVLHIAVAHGALRVALVAPEERAAHSRGIAAQHRQQTDAIWRERFSVGILAAATLLVGVLPIVITDFSASGVAPIAAADTMCSVPAMSAKPGRFRLA